MSTTFRYTDGGRIQDGFIFERMDCTVRAFALAANISYAESHWLFANAGRQNCRGISFPKFMKKFHPDVMHIYTVKPRPRVYTFLKQNTHKNVVARIRKHVFYVKDNVILDNDCWYANCIVTDIWVFDND